MRMYICWFWQLQQAEIAGLNLGLGLRFVSVGSLIRGSGRRVWILDDLVMICVEQNFDFCGCSR